MYRWEKASRDRRVNCPCKEARVGSSYAPRTEHEASERNEVINNLSVEKWVFSPSRLATNSNSKTFKWLTLSPIFWVWFSDIILIIISIIILISFRPLRSLHPRFDLWNYFEQSLYPWYLFDWQDFFDLWKPVFCHYVLNFGYALIQNKSKVSSKVDL